MMCYKFHQTRTINEEFDSWVVKGVGCLNFKNSEKPVYITMVPTHTENYSTLAQSESV